jgi:hypothetical protein
VYVRKLRISQQFTTMPQEQVQDERSKYYPYLKKFMYCMGYESLSYTTEELLEKSLLRLRRT